MEEVLTFLARFCRLMSDAIWFTEYRNCTMSTTVTMEEAQARLPELVGQLGPGDELIITQNRQPVAMLVAAPMPARPAPGLGKGSILYMAPDFDEPLEEMKEYME